MKNIKQTGSYFWMKVDGRSIKNFLIENTLLFDDSFNFFGFYVDYEITKRSSIKIEEAWITDDTILFSGIGGGKLMDCFIDKIYWDDFGTWFVNFFPSAQNEIQPKVIIDSNNLLNLNEVRNQNDEGYLFDENWTFLHSIKSDMFISLQGEFLVIGSLKEQYLKKLNLNF